MLDLETHSETDQFKMYIHIFLLEKIRLILLYLKLQEGSSSHNIY